MRKFKKLTKEDLQYIVDNSPILTNKELAEKLEIGEPTLAVYKTVLRKLGVNIVSKRSHLSNREVMTEFAKEWHEKIKV
jgi:hypothetical protein